MADNVAVTAGTGTTIAADEVVDGTLGTVKVQYVKLMDGTIDGTAKATVKAASTAPLATDPAIVVAISPNGQQPSGQQTAANSTSVVMSSDNSTVTAVGNVAASVANSGNPVLVGGVASSAGPTGATNGQRQNLWLSGNGAMVPAGIVRTRSDAAGTGLVNLVDMSGSARLLEVVSDLFNGTTMDTPRNNMDTAALVTLSAQAAGTVNSADQTNYNGRGVQVGINVTASTSMTLTINIQGKDTASGTYYTILSSTAIAANGFTNLTVYPGAAVTANASSPQPLPRTWRAQAVVTGTSVTATVGASVIL